MGGMTHTDKGICTHFLAQSDAGVHLAFQSRVQLQSRARTATLQRVCTQEKERYCRYNVGLRCRQYSFAPRNDAPVPPAQSQPITGHVIAIFISYTRYEFIVLDKSGNLYY